MQIELNLNYERASLRLLLCGRTRDVHLIEDICHDVFIDTVLWHERNPHESIPKPAFFKKAALNKLKDHFRKQSHRNHTAGDETLLAIKDWRHKAIEELENIEYLDQQLNRLPARYKKAIQLWLSGYDVRSTSEVMHIDYLKAKQLRTRALQRLRELSDFSKN